MNRVYPQETIGTTLLQQSEFSERRRVFVNRRNNYIEVGEFTKGPHTQEFYGAPCHYHAVHVFVEDAVELARKFFTRDDACLADYMDILEAQKISYGYLSNEPGKLVAYRPRHLSQEPITRE